MRSEQEIIEAMRRAIERETLEPTSDSIAKSAYAVIAADMAELRAMKESAEGRLRESFLAQKDPKIDRVDKYYHIGVCSSANSVLFAAKEARESHAL